MFKTKTRSVARLIFATAAFHCLGGPAQASERVVLHFGHHTQGEDLPKTVLGAHLMILHHPKTDFLTPDSTPPTPFPDGVHGLLVERESLDDLEARVRVLIRPYAPSMSPEVGWVEMEMVVNSASHNGMDLGSGGTSNLSSAKHATYDGNVIFGLNLNLDKPIDIMTFPGDTVRKVMHSGSPSPAFGVPFRFRIAWDLSGETSTFQFFIDDIPLHDSSGDDLIIEMPKDVVREGIDYISLMLHDAVLGRITASEQLTLSGMPGPGQEYEWVKVTGEAAFAPRDGAGALVHRGKMWLIGGWNPNDKKNFPLTCTNDVWSSVDGATWTLEKPNTFVDAGFDSAADWEGRHTAGYVMHQDKMWIVGGDPIQRHYQNDVWNSGDGVKWTQANADRPVPWGPRALHYTVAFKGKIWVIGGQTMPQFAPEEERFYRDIWNSEDGVNWTQVTPVEPFWPQRGMIGGSVVFKDRIWILGGGTYDTPKIRTRKFYNDVWSSADGVHWQLHLENAPWHPRQYHEVAVFDNKMWVLEGWDNGNRNDVWYSADGVDWKELPDTPWPARHAASVFVHDDALWVVAGNNMTSDVWKLVRTTPK